MFYELSIHVPRQQKIQRIDAEDANSLCHRLRTEANPWRRRWRCEGWIVTTSGCGHAFVIYILNHIDGVAERRVFFCKTWFEVLRSNLSGFCGLSTDALAICDSIAAEKSTHCVHRVLFIIACHRWICLSDGRQSYMNWGKCKIHSLQISCSWNLKAQGKLSRKSCDLVTLPFRCALGSSVSVSIQWIVVSCCFLCCVAWGLYSPGLLLRCYDIAYCFVSVNLRSSQG